MKYKKIKKKYGEKLAKKILEKMNGQTVGINKDGSLDYYEWDIERAVKEIKTGRDIGVWD